MPRTTGSVVAEDVLSRMGRQSCLHPAQWPRGDGQCRQCGILMLVPEESDPTPQGESTQVCWVCEAWMVHRIQPTRLAKVRL
mmetsp:Transcript_24374/g.78736  ORF Transcript_24374/g.78736 Transcript_24374/m.78736 type:complete len:82 (+) Transcript_24374:1583-1828(+)